MSGHESDDSESVSDTNSDSWDRDDAPRDSPFQNKEEEKKIVLPEGEGNRQASGQCCEQARNLKSALGKRHRSATARAARRNLRPGERRRSLPRYRSAIVHRDGSRDGAGAACGREAGDLCAGHRGRRGLFAIGSDSGDDWSDTR